MTYDELNTMWADDGAIDSSDIINETTRIPALHNKYYTLLVEESLRLRRLMGRKNVLLKEKTEYFSGQMDIEDIKDRGWAPLPRMILKADVSRHVEADSEMVELNLKIAARKSVCDFLESIVGMIQYRSQSLKLIHDVERFRSGG